MAASGPGTGASIPGSRPRELRGHGGQGVIAVWGRRLRSKPLRDGVGDRRPCSRKPGPLQVSEWRLGTNHIHQLGYHGDRTLILGLQLDWPEFGVVGLKHDTDVPPAVLVRGFLAPIALDGESLAGIRVDRIAQLDKHRPSLAGTGDGAREQAVPSRYADTLDLNLVSTDRRVRDSQHLTHRQGWIVGDDVGKAPLGAGAGRRRDRR